MYVLRSGRGARDCQGDLKATSSSEKQRPCRYSTSYNQVCCTSPSTVISKDITDAFIIDHWEEPPEEALNGEEAVIEALIHICDTKMKSWCANGISVLISEYLKLFSRHIQSYEDYGRNVASS